MPPFAYKGSMDGMVFSALQTGLAGVYKAAHEHHGDWAPSVEVYVDNEKVDFTSLSESVVSRLVSVTVEDSVEQASAITLEIVDEDYSYTDGVTFAEGREVSVWMGYDSSMLMVGRGVIVRALPDFSDSGVCILTVTAYDKSYKMGIAEVEADEEKDRGRRKETGKTFSGTWAEIVSQVYEKYGIVVYADEEMRTTRPSFPVIQAKKVTDAAFVQGIANILGAELFVTWRPYDQDGRTTTDSGRLYRLKGKGLPIPAQPGQWVCYFRSQPKKPEGPMYHWQYRVGDESSLCAFHPEPGPLSAATSIQVLFRDPVKKEWVVLGKEHDPAPSGFAYRKEKRIVKGWVAKAIRRNRQDQGQPTNVPITEEEIVHFENLSREDQLRNGLLDGVAGGDRERVVRKRVKVGPRKGIFGDDAYRSSLTTDLRIVAGQHALDVRAAKRFRTASEAVKYAEAWYEKNRQNFWVASGELATGTETVRAGQIHQISGVGRKYSGLYYLASVTHKVDGQTYSTEFVGRRVNDETLNLDNV